MTAPAPEQQPTAAQQAALAYALSRSQSQDDNAHILAWLLLLDPPAARALVTIVWHPTANRPRPWRYAPNSMAGSAQAGYLTAAAERISIGLDEGRPLADLIAREVVYARQHIAAQRARNLALVQVQRAKRRYGNLLGWRATIDLRTSRACALAHKKNFNPATGPFPGSLHGGSCRCVATRPWPTSETVVGAWVKAGLGDHAEDAWETAA